MMHSLQIHLFYASIVWVVAWLVTSLPMVSATTKYWIWVVTSVNFVLPLNTIPGRLWASRISWFTPGVEIAGFTVTEPLLVLWIAGAVVMTVRLWWRIRNDRHDQVGPAVVGLLKTRILLPDGMDRILDSRELLAVVAHEKRHARRHDNLIRLFHELTVCALWFHPFVWLAGSRLALYRELSCDEAVDDGRDLISALSKLASPENEILLHATASSFIGDRIAYLRRRPRTSRLADGLLGAVFFAALLAAVISPIAQSTAAYLCALTHGTPQ
jgi:hypothetical protein